MLCNGDREPACVARMVRKPAIAKQPSLSLRRACRTCARLQHVRVCLRQPDWDVEVEWGVARKEMYGIDRQMQASTREPKPKAGGNPFGGFQVPEMPNPFGGEVKQHGPPRRP